MFRQALAKIKTWMPDIDCSKKKETPAAFIEWRDEINAQKGWTDDRLSLEAGMSRAVLRKARQGRLPMSNKVIRIADAFSCSRVIALRKAGLLPSDGGAEVEFSDWMYLLNQLPTEEQEELRQLAEKRSKKHLLETKNIAA